MNSNYIMLEFVLNQPQVDQYNDQNHNPSLILMDNRMIIVVITFEVMSKYYFVMLEDYFDVYMVYN